MKVFWLREEHITLVRAMWVSWNGIEAGAPMIDPKRPYGGSNVTGDIGTLLGWQKSSTGDYGDPDWSEQDYEGAMALHYETETALQIILRTGSFTPGRYVTDDHDYGWDRVQFDAGQGSVAVMGGSCVCPTCQGEGFVPSDMGSDICYGCDGLGIVPCNEIPDPEARVSIPELDDER